jgi:Arc/MetJ-type ribon-helix-helix transcriptional regulator
MVQLTDELVAALDEEAARRGQSRSAVIREALEEFLDRREEAAIARRIIDGYRRIPPATPDEWGDVDDLVDRSTTELLQRLEAEERQAGHAPW